jgi:hypothetical protein
MNVGSVESIFFAMVTGDFAGAIKQALISHREVRVPCWRNVQP